MTPMVSGPSGSQLSVVASSPQLCSDSAQGHRSAICRQAVRCGFTAYRIECKSAELNAKP